MATYKPPSQPTDAALELRALHIAFWLGLVITAALGLATIGGVVWLAVWLLR